jgi:hypothetical protein
VLSWSPFRIGSPALQVHQDPVIYLVRVHLLRLVVLAHLEMRVLVVGTPVGFFDGTFNPGVEVWGAFLREKVLPWLFVQ